MLDLDSLDVPLGALGGGCFLVAGLLDVAGGDALPGVLFLIAAATTLASVALVRGEDAGRRGSRLSSP